MLLSGTWTYSFCLDLGSQHLEARFHKLFVLTIFTYHSFVMTVVRLDYIEVVLSLFCFTANSTKDVNAMFLLRFLRFLNPWQSCMASLFRGLLWVNDCHRMHFSVKTWEGSIRDLLSFYRFPVALNWDPGTKTEIKKVPIVKWFFLAFNCTYSTVYN